jgi:dTDP-4-dehydrorhamnose reductase
VGERYFDQLIWNGHQTRADDLDVFAGLGIQAIRYPVVWERTAPDGLDSADWRWTDERLGRLRRLGIRPIAGLVHHGSGPSSTSLVDPAFPQKLAGYARAVAERYPWLDAYTPINEPLTTARFSGLYGFWYPHTRDARVFLRALLNQVRGVQLSMRAIRAVNPDATLVQTEDMGKVYSMPALRYQAEHENERRWLSFDLLCGRVDRHHPLYGYLRSLHISQAELEQIQQDAVAPDILGINYYVTSERFLDDRLDLYPPELHGGNAYDRYVDTEAVRVCQDTIAGHSGILQEAWERYRLPLALTEVHLGGDPHHQLRWLMEAWNAAQDLRRGGVDVRALTAWALLGSFNWDNLVTRDEGHYEPGVFDVRGSHPSPTLLAQAVESLARQGTFTHPALETPGWWRDPARMLYPCVECQERPIPIRLEDAAQNQEIVYRR